MAPHLHTTPAVQNSICKQWLRTMQFSVFAKMSPSNPALPNLPTASCCIVFFTIMMRFTPKGSNAWKHLLMLVEVPDLPACFRFTITVHPRNAADPFCRPFLPWQPEAHPATFQLELPGTVRSQTRCRAQAQAKHRSSASASVQLILSLGGFSHANERWGGQWTCTYKSSCVVIAGVAWIPDLEALRKARRRPPLDSAACSSADAIPLQYRNFDATLPSRGGSKGANSADPWWYSCSRPALLHHSFFLGVDPNGVPSTLLLRSTQRDLAHSRFGRDLLLLWHRGLRSGGQVLQQVRVHLLHIGKGLAVQVLSDEKGP